MALIHRDCLICKSKNSRKLVTVEGNRRCDYINNRHTFVLCENCGLCFLNPQNSQEDYTKYYSEEKTTRFTGQDYQGEFRKEIESQYHKESEFIAGYIDRSLGFPDKKIKILDVGAGHGNLLYAFSKLGYSDVLGLEPSEELVCYAEKVFGQKVLRGSLEENDLPKGACDLILCTSMLDHLSDPLRGLRKMREFLKDGGHIFVRVHNVKDMVLRKGIGAFFKFVHLYNFSENSLSNLIKLAGFEIVSVKMHHSLLDNSSFFDCGNYRLGMINIIAKKIDTHGIEKKMTYDSVWEIESIFLNAKRRDFIYRMCYRILMSRYCGGFRRVYLRLFGKNYIDVLNKIYAK